MDIKFAWLLVSFLSGFIGGLIVGFKINKPAVKVSKIKQKGGPSNTMDTDLDINLTKNRKRNFSPFKRNKNETKEH